MNKQQIIAKVISSEEFIRALKKVPKDEQQFIEETARNLIGGLYDSIMGSVTRFQNSKKNVEDVIDDTKLVNEKDGK